jgi:uracil-DNA glycosylase family 4
MMKNGFTKSAMTDELTLDQIEGMQQEQPVLRDVSKRKHPLAECETCPLIKARCAPTTGPADATVAVVSRSPGYYDARAKKPFSGPSGKILDHLLGLYGVKRDEILTTNVVLCEFDGTPPKEAIAACKPRLNSEIKDARTIIAAGAEAVGNLTRSKSLDGARGYAHERHSSVCKQRVIATNNPAIVLRDDSAFPNLVRDFRLALAPLPVPRLPDVDWTNNIEEGRRWLRAIRKQNVSLLTFDIETLGLRPSAGLVAIGFADAGDKAVSIGERVCRDKTTYLDYIAPLIKDHRLLAHNGKFDLRNFRAKGVKGILEEDTMLLSWALDERSDEGQVHRLEYLLMDNLNWPNYEPEVVRQWKSTVKRLEKQFRYEELDELPIPDELYTYNALDAAGTALLFPILKNRAIEDGVFELYRRFLIKASEALLRVELRGLNYDIEGALDLLEDKVWPRLEELKAEMQLIVGDGKYNPRSSTQNAALVYDKWHVVHNLPLKNDRTVDKSVYTEIAAGRFVVAFGTPKTGQDTNGEGQTWTGADRKQAFETAKRWAEKFKDYQGLDKQRSTYLEGLIKRAVANGGKLFTDFKLHGTATGRLSSSNPNLQNITRTKEGLPDIRSLFVASEGCTLISADYSQAELRTIARLSGDGSLGQVYVDERDLHAVAAERFYGPGFTYEQRSIAKNMNFGVAYQQSPDTFQEKHGIPKEEAAKYIEWWWKEFAGVREWANTVEKEVLKGEVVSPFGFKRRFHLITKENRKGSIREGINFLPQNIAAWFTNYALCRLVLDYDLPIALSVHDSIIADCPSGMVSDVVPLIVDVMERAPKETLGWDFPFKAEAQIGQRWGKLEDYEVS